MTDLASDVRSGDRRALARAITLVESRRPDHKRQARDLLDELLPYTGDAVRVGISGSPGSGKSTVIEALGLLSIDQGHRVAVLAVDPSSNRSGGSILGDKTRMVELARHADAFIRPSPSGGTLGGVARNTREALLLCEAAGFDVVMIETVGVGQSEVAVADLVDIFVFVASPTGGDDLQGIKRGIMELADVVVVNKADGELVDAARRACADLRKAVHLLRPKYDGYTVPVETVSALTNEGIDRLWRTITECREWLRSEGFLARLQADQAVAWMWNEVEESLMATLREQPSVRAQLPALEAAVRSGELSPTSAASRLLELGRSEGSEGSE